LWTDLRTDFTNGFSVFSGRSGGQKNLFPTFFQNLDPFYRPVAGKPLVLKVLCLEVGTSVASALTAETGFEIIKCMSDVDMPARARMGSKSEILRFFNSGYAHDRNISIFRRRASRLTGNTLIKPKYASARQSRDSLHRDRHKVTKKVAVAPCSETAGAEKLQKLSETCFLAHYYACKFGLNRLRIDGDIRQKPL